MRWVHYHVEGYDRYEVVEGEGGEREVRHIPEESGEWDYTHWDDADATRPTVPIGYIDLPMSSNPGYSMAQESNYLYNLLSDVRNLIRVANHPKLAGDVTDEQFEYTEVALQRGSNMLQGPWEFIGPPPENAATGYEIYKQEVRDFYVTSHQRYNDAAREVTATEARQDDASGRQSYLVLLSGTLDELENRVLFLMAQKQFPTNREQWMVNYAMRSTDFKADNSSEFADRLMRRYFDGPVPVGPTGQGNAAKTIAALDGIEVEEDEIDAGIEEQRIEAEQARAAESELNSLLDAA
jgi:hypothetical protein